MKKKILLIGGFHKARLLSDSLIKKGYKVTIINDNYDNCMSLAENKNIKVIFGDGTKPFVLEDADVYNIDMAIALTRSDEDNLVACQLCKKKFKILKTVSLVNDPEKTDFFRNMGIDSVVCAINGITSIIEQQALLEDMATLIPIGKSDINILEVLVPKTSPIIGKKLWEINLPMDAIIAYILRGENSMIPRGDTRIMIDDILILIVSKDKQEEVIRELTGRKTNEN